ncbi:hypothetical protein AR687_14725 [Flavobacteriaceae bacterium CRH]|nr:hypothetical protein AR687_14725 [Flavobacteriaceae bacterium CRH]
MFAKIKTKFSLKVIPGLFHKDAQRLHRDTQSFYLKNTSRNFVIYFVYLCETFNIYKTKEIIKLQLKLKYDPY